MPFEFEQPTSYEDAQTRLDEQVRRIQEIEAELGARREDVGDDAASWRKRTKSALGMAQSERLFLKRWLGQRREPDDRSMLLVSACIQCGTPLPPFDRGNVYGDGWLKVRLSARGETYTVWICPTDGAGIAADVEGHLGARHADQGNAGHSGSHVQHGGRVPARGTGRGDGQHADAAAGTVRRRGGSGR